MRPTLSMKTKVSPSEMKAIVCEVEAKYTVDDGSGCFISKSVPNNRFTIHPFMSFLFRTVLGREMGGNAGTSDSMPSYFFCGPETTEQLYKKLGVTTILSMFWAGSTYEVGDFV